MLTYSFKYDKNNTIEYKELECSDVYVAPDASLVSGVTSVNYALRDGQIIYIGSDMNGLKPVTISTTNVWRQGKVLYPREYEVVDYTEYFVSSNHEITVKSRMVTRYNDGLIYPANEDNNIVINGVAYPIEYHSLTNDTNKSYSSITIPTYYYVEDGYVTINDIQYEVELDLRTDERTPIIFLTDGTPLIVEDYMIDKWKEVTKFIIQKDIDYNLEMDSVTCAKQYEYIYFGKDFQYKGETNCCIDEDYDVNTDSVVDYHEHKIYFQLTEDKTRKFIEIEELNRTIYVDLTATTISGITSDDDEREVIIETEWRSTNYDENYLFLMTAREDLTFTPGQIILVEGDTFLQKSYSVEEIEGTSTEDGSNMKLGYITYCGKKYYIDYNKTCDFINVNNTLYELYILKHYTDGRYLGYYYCAGQPIPVIVEGNKAKRYTFINTELLNASENNYNVENLNYVLIHGKRYPVHSYEYYIDSTETTTKGDNIVKINGNDIYELVIEEVTNPNMLRCRLNGDSDMDEIYSIYVNRDRYSFKLVNEIVNHNLVSETFRFDDEYFSEGSVRFYAPQLFWNLRMPLSLAIGGNQNQIYSVSSDFYEAEKNNAINPIVDMEKDIYEPVYFSEDNGRKTPHLFSKIRFNLHFRTRNLDDWSINEDIYAHYDKAEACENSKYVDWNFINYYIDNVNELELDTIGQTNAYYPPSDLLYFLNFTDNDVFYQKTKIGKSFIRLSFFDSNDPKNQSLLHTATIFLDDNKLYKKYIDNSNDSELKSLCFQSITNPNICNNYIQVDYEPTDGSIIDDEESTKFIFDDESRLDMSIEVNNRYENTSSSEGFYLYIFKEFSTNLHERTIYMKIDFNHAGTGKICSMFVPTKTTNDVTEMINFKEDTDAVSELRNGIPLKQVFSTEFIPLNVIYSDELKKYIYYFPEYLTDKLDEDKKDEMIFNLFEIKIKDESY